MTDTKQKKRGRFSIKLAKPNLIEWLAFFTLLATLATIFIPEIRIILGLSEETEGSGITKKKSDIYFDTETLFFFSADKGKAHNLCEGRLFFNTLGEVLYVYSCPDNEKYYEIGSYEIIQKEVKCIFNRKTIVVNSNFYTNQTDITIESNKKENSLILIEVGISTRNQSNYYFEYKNITYSCKPASDSQLRKFIHILKKEGSYDIIQDYIDMDEVSSKSYAKIFSAIKNL